MIGYICMRVCANESASPGAWATDMLQAEVCMRSLLVVDDFSTSFCYTDFVVKCPK